LVAKQKQPSDFRLADFGFINLRYSRGWVLIFYSVMTETAFRRRRTATPALIKPRTASEDGSGIAVAFS
jgi:hypothetical protein